MSDLIPGEGFRFRRVTGEVFPSCVLVDAPGGWTGVYSLLFHKASRFTK